MFKGRSQKSIQRDNIRASVRRGTETAITAVAISEDKSRRVVFKICIKAESKGFGTRACAPHIHLDTFPPYSS
jgi:hypothetical protein